MKKVARLRNSEEILGKSEPMAVRTTGRIKKAKVVFDPSDNYLPRYQRSSAGSVNSNQQSQLDALSDCSNERSRKEEKTAVTPVDPMDSNICYLCARKDSKKVKIKLISCKDCENKVHVTCLPLEFEDQNKLRENYRCNSCQVCSSCYEGTEDGGLITCTKCVKSFHFACHIPSMARFPTQAKWLCSKCTIPKVKSLLKAADVKPVNSNTDVKPDIQEVQEIKEANSSLENKVTTPPVANGNQSPNKPLSDSSEIPNVKNWSAGDVMEFFMKFFPEEAHVFREHDIDGQSLLLMRRSDVVNSLAIRLGPALRMYNLILKIQSQSTDPTLGWYS